MIERYAVYGFESTHDALSAESVLACAGVPFATIPTPKSLGALCGIALRVAARDASAAEAALIVAGLRWKARAEIEDRAPRGLSR
ncbi:DUF3343 domain-containing protein [Coriobacteriia bacterium Es71-Z0120]|uniref:DUF3343 domain-containing protein n=1 Tax=Parvivirga hydrogeniphila TaxID=2939460 RepID=UPI0022610151|nr:DUF3343 domain-containing protein [Parvivirga hydrogeniphila]MCL4078466.1 DUF3343 domain-containing protein [Parvivirga hydrogeniphila]